MGAIPRPDRRHPAPRRAALAVVAAAGVLLRGSPVRAGATTPTPVLAAASGAAAGSARTATLDGVFDYPNAVQSGTALQVVVFQGTRFVRYPLSGTPVTGDSSLLADGALDQAEIPAFLATGTSAPASVRFLTLTASQARVALPTSFATGPATAVVFGVFGAESVLSNPLTFVLP